MIDRNLEEPAHTTSSGLNGLVADYWADKNEVKHEYNLDLIENYNLDDYQAIIVAVVS